MLRTLSNSFKVACFIVGTTVGAGYASGRELWEFFGSYGSASQKTLPVALFLFTVSCYVIMELGRRLQAKEYRQVLTTIIGPRLTLVYDGLILFYLLGTTVVMFAGSGAALHHWGVPYWLGVFLTALFVLLVFIKKTQGVLMLNSVLAPLMISFLLGACLIYLWQGEGVFPSGEGNFPQALASAIAFTSFNILPLVAVLSVIGAELNERETLLAAIASGVGLALLSLIYNQALLGASPMASRYDVPLFALFQQFPKEWLVGLSIVLWLAIYTTAVSNLFGLIARFKVWFSQPDWLVALLLVFCMLPLTAFGFTRLIQILYPLYGVLNLFLLSLILLYPLTKEPDP